MITALLIGWVFLGYEVGCACAAHAFWKSKEWGWFALYVWFAGAGPLLVGAMCK